MSQNITSLLGSKRNERNMPAQVITELLELFHEQLTAAGYALDHTNSSVNIQYLAHGIYFSAGSLRFYAITGNQDHTDRQLDLIEHSSSILARGSKGKFNYGLFCDEEVPASDDIDYLEP